MFDIIGAPRIFLWEGGGFRVLSLFDFMYHVMKVMSESRSRHPVRLQGKLKLTKQEKLYIFLSFYSIFKIPMY